MDESRTFECPSCGGELTTDGLTPTIQCPYCGQTVSLPEGLRVKPAAPPPPAPESPLIPLIQAAEAAAERERETRPAPAPRRRGGGCGCGSIIFALLLIFGVLIAAAILSGNGPVLLSALNAASGATPTPRPVSQALSSELPRALRYAGVVLSVTGGELTNRDPSATGAPLYRSDRLYAILDVKLDNTSGDREVALPYDGVRLQLSDGEQYQDTSGFNYTVASAATRSGRLVFRVPLGSNWQGARLMVVEGGKEPATLALDGKAPAVPGPTDLKLAAEKPVGTIVYRVLNARLDTARKGVQVDQGKRYLSLNMRVVNDGKEAGGVTVAGGNFRLLVDGDSLAPDDYMIEAIPPQSKVDGEVVFTVPATAKAAILQVGDLNGPKGQIPVNLKP